MYATDCLTKLEHRKAIAAQVEEIANQIPEAELLQSMPGIGPKTAAAILMTVGDFSDFPSAAELASYAGLCPRTNQSGTSINSNGVNRAGNKKLKNASQAIIFFGYQIPRTFTPILRTQTQPRQETQRCGDVPSP